MGKDALKNASSEDLKAFLEWLAPNADEAERRYFELRERLIKIIFRNSSDAEELADETLARAIEKAASRDRNADKIENFIFRIARFLKLEQSRKPSLDELPENLRAAEDSTEKDALERQYEVIEKCLEQLPAEDRDLFLQYTFPPETEDVYLFRRNLAKRENISMNYLRVKIKNIRDKIRKCAEIEDQ